MEEDTGTGIYDSDCWANKFPSHNCKPFSIGLLFDIKRLLVGMGTILWTKVIQIIHFSILQ